MMQELIVTTGYPCSGKSTVAKYLEDSLHFVRISTDDLRQKMYSVEDYPSFSKSPDFNEREALIWDVLEEQKADALERGKDVVVDVSAPKNKVREKLLEVSIALRFLKVPINRYLLYLDVCKDILKRRNIQKGRTNDPVAEWSPYWEEPKQGKTYQILKYENNTQDRLAEILVNLDKRFRKQGRVYVPISP